VDVSDPIVWTGISQEVCYNLDPDVNPKQLRLYSGDGSSWVYYINAITNGATLALPTSSQSCVNVTFSSGLPIATYTLVLEDSATNTPQATASVNTATASVFFSRVFWTDNNVELTVQWSVDAAHASWRDWVEVFDTSSGERVDWAYTSCSCKVPLLPAVPSGNLTFDMSRSDCDPGGYTVRLFPGGGDVEVAVGFQWIDWAKICGTA
jgi:hypothetical protein